MPSHFLPRTGISISLNTCSSRVMCFSVSLRCALSADFRSPAVAFLISFGSALVSCFSAS